MNRFDYLERQLRAKWTVEKVEKELDKIEKMGYKVSTLPESVQISRDGELIIDADFFDDYFLNAAHAVDGFLS